MRLASALAELHTVAGWCAFDSRADDRAGHHFRLAVELAASAGDAYRRSQALRHAGAMLDQGGHHNDALKCYQMGQIGLYDAHGEEPRAAPGAWLHMVSARALAHRDRPDLAARELAAARDGWQPPNSFEQADMDHVAAKVQLRLGRLDSAEHFAVAATRVWGAGARREALLTSITRAQIHLQAGEPSGIALAQQAVTTVEQLSSNRARDRLAPPADALEARRQPDLARRARHVAARRRDVARFRG